MTKIYHFSSNDLLSIIAQSNKLDIAKILKLTQESENAYDSLKEYEEIEKGFLWFKDWLIRGQIQIDFLKEVIEKDSDRYKGFIKCKEYMFKACSENMLDSLFLLIKDSLNEYEVNPVTINVFQRKFKLKITNLMKRYLPTLELSKREVNMLVESNNSEIRKMVNSIESYCTDELASIFKEELSEVA